MVHVHNSTGIGDSMPATRPAALALARPRHAEGVGQLAEGGDGRVGLRLLDLHQHALAEAGARRQLGLAPAALGAPLAEVPGQRLLDLPGVGHAVSIVNTRFTLV
jgi:hypothetical protein